MALESKKDIKKYYETSDVVSSYTGKRFTNPIGYFQHYMHVKVLNRIIRKNSIRKIIELAPGNARVTKDVSGFNEGFAIENSQEMINAFKQTLAELGKLKNWKIEKHDIFKIKPAVVKKYSNEFDMLYTFRFIRHFHKPERSKIYEIVKKFIKKDGLFVFDAPNYNVEYKIRKRIGFEKFRIYDELWKKQDLIMELEQAGFYDIRLANVINHTYIQSVVSKIIGGIGLKRVAFNLIKMFDIRSRNPVEWVVICRKR